MLSIGENKIKALYRGDTKIQRAYLGEAIVFDTAKPLRLPEGYAEVEYISNPNLGYAIGVPPVKNPLYETRYEFDVEITKIPAISSYLWGKTYYYNYSNYKRHDFQALFISGNEQKVGCYCSYSASSSSYSPIYIPFSDHRLKIIIDSPKGLFEVNGSQASINKKTSGSYLSDPPELFARKYYYKAGISATDAVGKEPLNFNFYTLKIFSSTANETGDLLYEYTPCIDPNGDVGIYELVHGVFTKSADSAKPFVAGPTV